MARRQHNFNANRSWKDMTPEDAAILERSVAMPSELLESDHEDFTAMRMMLANKDAPHPYAWARHHSHHYYMAALCDDQVIERRALMHAGGAL